MNKKIVIYLMLGGFMNASNLRCEEKPVNFQHEKVLIEQLVIGGIYQHYSGKQYRVINIFRNSEDLTLWVAYQGLYEDTELGINWIRPLEMFLEKVEIKGVLTPRFKKIADK